MNIYDIIIIVLLAAAVAFALFLIFKKKKGGCSCGCENCGKTCPSAKKNGK